MALGNSNVKGLAAVLSKLSKEIRKIEGRTEQGMIQAGFLIQRESQRNTPVDTGNLRGGARTSWERAPGNFKVAVSYQAHYAIIVHERYATHKVGDWKYLQRAVTENWSAILHMIASEAQIP